MEPFELKKMIEILKKPAEYSLEIVSEAMRAILEYAGTPVPVTATVSGGHHDEYRR